METIVPPSARAAATVASAASTLRSHPTTSAPSRANARAAARPMLPPVPVMMHTFPVSLADISHANFDGQLREQGARFDCDRWLSVTHERALREMIGTYQEPPGNDRPS